MRDILSIDSIGTAWVGQASGNYHPRCEDRYRVVPPASELVEESGRGAVFAVFDGVGSLPRAGEAAQHMADRLFDYYDGGQGYERGFVGLSTVLEEASEEIADWEKKGKEFKGGCAGVIALEEDDSLCLFSAGDCELWIRRNGEFETIFEGEGSRLLTNRFGRSFADGFELESRIVSLKGVDRICCLSDGVANAARDAMVDMVDYFVQSEPQQWIRELFERTCPNGPADDWTLVVADL